jgi:transcriptional regulator
MYTPKAFNVENHDTLHAFIEKYEFAILITQKNNDMEISHIPLMLDKSFSNVPCLLGHIAVKNPQHTMLKMGCDAIAIFHGPHGYISPSWYASAFNVPTWNYTAVHVRGKAKVIDDPERLKHILEMSIQKYEKYQEQPWFFDWNNNRKTNLMSAIVGIEIAITHIQGKFKLSQNRSEADIKGVLAGLENDKNPDSALLVDFMRSQSLINN